MAEQVNEIAEYQIIRPDGTVLLSAVALAGLFGGWDFPPLEKIWEPCVTRWRMASDSQWTLVTYFPDGYPGQDGHWPDGVREKLARL